MVQRHGQPLPDPDEPCAVGADPLGVLSTGTPAAVDGDGGARETTDVPRAMPSRGPGRHAKRSPGTSVHAARSREKSRVGRNLASLVSSQVAAWAVSAAMLVVVPHFLAATDFGALQFGNTFVSYFMLVGALGTSTFLVKAVARDSSVLGSYVFNALIMKAVLAALLSGAAITLAHVLGYPGRTELIVEIACVGMVFALLNDVLRAGLQGIERMGGPAAWAVVQAYVASAVGLVILVHHRGVIAYAFTLAVAGSIPVIANLGHISKWIRGSLRVDLTAWRQIAIGGFPFLLWASVLVIYGTIDIPIIQAMAGNATVGWYALAYAWVSMPAGFSSLVVTAALPSLSASAHEAPTEFRELANRAIRLVILVGVPASAGIALVAPDVFKLFHYQAGFAHAIPLIRILALHIPIVGMDMVLGTALIASDKQRQWTIIGCVAALFNPLVNLLAIPLAIHLTRNGAIGASVVTVLTEALMMVGAIYLRPRGVLDRSTVWFIVKCVFASSVMIGTILALQSTPLPVKIGLGVVVYFMVASAIRAVSIRDLRSINLGASKSCEDGGLAVQGRSPEWRHRVQKSRRQRGEST